MDTLSQVDRSRALDDYRNAVVEAAETANAWHTMLDWKQAKSQAQHKLRNFRFRALS
ncbi:MAG TPA: hypothetical protein VF534_31095 [Paraburkholderia sp.]